MDGNLLVILFVFLFFLFLVESIFFIKNKLHVETFEKVDSDNQNQKGKMILIGGLLTLVVVTVALLILFKNQFISPTAQMISIPSPTVYIEPLPPTPTLVNIAVSPITTGKPNPLISIPAVNVSIIPTKTPKPTKTPVPTKTPIPTKTPVPTKTPTLSPTPKSGTQVLSPSIIVPIGEPVVLSPTIVQSTTSAVIVPKMPVAGYLGQSMTLVFMAISSLIVGLLL